MKMFYKYADSRAFVLISVLGIVIGAAPLAVYGYFENICHFSDNARTRITSYPYISGDLFRLMADFVVDETTLQPDNGMIHGVSINTLPFDPALVKDGDIIFIHSRSAEGGLTFGRPMGRWATIPHFLEYFFEHIHPLIKAHYILLGANDDCRAPGEFAHYLDDEKIIAWFNINPDGYQHPKFHPIPVGICNAGRNHMISVEALEHCVSTSRKHNLLYVNINVRNNPSVRGRVVNILSKKNFCTLSGIKDFGSYLQDLAESKFVVSPAGNGLDCYRTWEALLMGSIPVVQHSSLDPLFEDLPVLLIHNWEDITEEFLNTQWDEMQKKTYKKERMYAHFWMQKIYDCQQQYREIVRSK